MFWRQLNTSSLILPVKNRKSEICNNFKPLRVCYLKNMQRNISKYFNNFRLPGLFKHEDILY